MSKPIYADKAEAAALAERFGCTFNICRCGHCGNWTDDEPRCEGPTGEECARGCSGLALGYGLTPNLSEACGARFSRLAEGEQ